MKLFAGIVLVVVFGWAYYKHNRDIIHGKWAFMSHALRIGAIGMVTIGILLIVLHFFEPVPPESRTFILDHPYYSH